MLERFAGDPHPVIGSASEAVATDFAVPTSFHILPKFLERSICQVKVTIAFSETDWLEDFYFVMAQSIVD